MTQINTKIVSIFDEQSSKLTLPTKVEFFPADFYPLSMILFQVSADEKVVSVKGATNIKIVSTFETQGDKLINTQSAQTPSREQVNVKIVSID